MRLQDSDLKSEYSELSDEELIQRLRDGDEGIADFLCDKYKNMVRAKARSMYILGADSEDLIQEGMIGLFKAIRDYDFGRDAAFSTFADLCISRQMYNAVTASGRKKHMPLNSYLSLSRGSGDSENGGSTPLEETLSFPEDNPEAIMIDQENVEDIEKFIDTELSSFEREVVELYLTGMSYVEISKVLGKDEKSTDNALQRVKGKLKKKLDDKVK